MRVRIGLGPAGLPSLKQSGDGGRFVDFVQQAEHLGYASICVGDHLDDRGAPLALLAAAAVVTDRITLAAHVLCNELRNPTVLAHEARSVQVLSRGRLELGLGVGWLERDFDAAGIAMAPFAERLDRVRSTADQVRSLGGARDLAAPTIVMGGGGTKMLTVAAQVADIVTLNIPLRSRAGLAANTVAQGQRAAFDDRLRLVRAVASAAGRTVGLHVYVHHVHGGPEWSDEVEAAAASLHLSADDYVASPHVLAGDHDEIVATIEARRAELGIDYLSIPGTFLDALAPVLELLRRRPS